MSLFASRRGLGRAALALAVWSAFAGPAGSAEPRRPAATPKPAASVGAATALPRTPQGRPDFSGIWQTLSAAEYDLEPHHARADAPAHVGVVTGGTLPYQPWALAKKQANFDQRHTLDPRLKCYSPGVPRAIYTPLPFQIFQADKHLTLLHEYAHVTRTIRTDGSPHPDGHIDWWMGDSRGHWDGDTLVVDVTHFNDQTWFDRAGNFHSDALHVVERFRFIDADHIAYRATIDDPQVYTRPWDIELLLYRRKEPQLQLLENECYAFDFEKFYP